jgi:hypothetical protein
MAKMSQSFNQRLAQGRLVDPAGDSAKFYLTELIQAEANHPSTQLARQALGSRMLEEARGAISKQDNDNAPPLVSPRLLVGRNRVVRLFRPHARPPCRRKAYYYF